MQVGGTFVDPDRRVIFENIDYPILDNYKEIVKGKVSSKVLAGAFNIEAEGKEQDVNMAIMESKKDGTFYIIFVNTDTESDLQRLVFLPIKPYNPKISMESMN